LKEVDKAWLACAIDSEGWFTYAFCGTLGCGDCPHPRIGISSTNKEYVEKVRSLIAYGDIKVWNSQASKKGVLPQYQYRVMKESVILRVLGEISPYLIVKREKAQELLKALKAREKRRKPF